MPHGGFICDLELEDGPMNEHERRWARRMLGAVLFLVAISQVLPR